MLNQPTVTRKYAVLKSTDTHCVNVVEKPTLHNSFRLHLSSIMKEIRLSLKVLIDR